MIDWKAYLSDLWTEEDLLNNSRYGTQISVDIVHGYFIAGVG